MKYALGNMLNGAGGLNADQLALDLQFAADKTLTARKGPTPVLTRGSSATFVGSNGLIQSAGNNVARFDHDPVTLASRGLLIEEGRTNQALYSGAWVAGIGWGTNTNTIASGVGPDGNTAYEFSESAASQTQTAGNTGTTTASSGTSVTSGVTYTGSAFVKKVAGNIDWIQISLGSGGFGTTQYANINLSNGAIGNSSGGTARVEPHANGWYRVSFTANATFTTATSISVIVGFIQNTNGTVRFPTYSGSPSNKFLVAMAQFEAGSFPTSYIPTTTSALARSADVCSITGASFTGMYNPLEGSLFTSAIFNAPVAYGTSQAIVDINDTTTANRLRLFRTSSNGFGSLANTSNSTQNVSIVTTTAQQPLVTQKYSSGFKLDDYAFYINNSQIGTDNLGAMPISVTTFTIGDASAGFTPRLYLNGTISAIRYYRKRLDNAKLQAITV